MNMYKISNISQLKDDEEREMLYMIIEVKWEEVSRLLTTRIHLPWRERKKDHLFTLISYCNPYQDS